jgi:hypothetical protein
MTAQFEKVYFTYNVLKRQKINSVIVQKSERLSNRMKIIILLKNKPLR